MKILTWIILAVILFLSLFRYHGAEINNEILGLALMLLLITLFSELKEFNFWGLRGNKYEKNFEELEGKNAISSSTKPDQKEVEKAESQPIQLLETTQGNFIALAFEIERLLRIYATVSLGKDVSSNINTKKLTKELLNNNLLTEDGAKQLDAIRWLRNILIHGRQAEINEVTLNNGIQLAYNFYLELFNFLNPGQNESK
jgi:uncharacterized protein YutE (UPF0331/DUF86 family)